MDYLKNLSTTTGLTFVNVVTINGTDVELYSPAADNTRITGFFFT
jgi:hypothetical protein